MDNVLFNQSDLALKLVCADGVTMEKIVELVDHHFPFPTANPGQKESIAEAVDAFINKKVKHVIIEAPTGVGKSIIGITIHQVLRSLVLEADPHGQFRSTICTPTKGLQDQYAKEKTVPLAILKGKKNYHCLVHQDVYYNSVQCRIACRDSMCRTRDCPYVKARNHWCNVSTIRCTNSAMLVEMCTTVCMKPENRSDLLILDECHKMPRTLLDHTIMEYDLSKLNGLEFMEAGRELIGLVEFVVRYTEQYVLGVLYDIDRELEAAFGGMYTYTEEMLEEMGEMIKRDDLTDVQVLRLSDIIDTLQNLSDYCGIMSDTEAKTFIVHEKDKGRILFKPVLSSDVAEFGMFRKADYHIHMSATICGIDAYAKSLGILSHEYHAIQIGNPIPLNNRKIHYMPVMKVNNQLEDWEMKRLVDAIDEIIEFNSTHTGIIHTVSYDRALAIQRMSKYKNIVHVPRTRKAILELMDEAFRTKTPVIIASPAMEEGYDFKGDYSRFQIIMKTPYEYLGDPLVAHVNKVDPSAYFREAVLRIVQMSGRSVRGIDDWAETYIVDQSFEGLVTRNGNFFPSWFLEAIIEY